MSQFDFVNLTTLPRSTALPAVVMAKAAQALPETYVHCDANGIQIHPHLAAAYQRVLDTDFTQQCWSLCSAQELLDTVYWCMLGGSFLADFAADSAQPRIFAWGLNPHPVAAHFALCELKGRDAARIPTAACTAAAKIMRFVNTDKMAIEQQQILDYLALGPAGLRVAANAQTPSSFVHEGVVQFIVPGISSAYGELVERFLALTGFGLMGVTSGNFSAKGKHRHLNGGTHKNLDEIQRNMGFLGIPILAGPVTGYPATTPLPELYTRLHAPYLALSAQERAAATALLPTSVTVVSPAADGKTWTVVRHGSLHYTVIQAALAKHGIEVVLADEKRLEIGRY